MGVGMLVVGRGGIVLRVRDLAFWQNRHIMGICGKRLTQRANWESLSHEQTVSTRCNMTSAYQNAYFEQISREVEQMPDEYLPMLLQVILLFRQTVTLKPADESFRQGWREAMRGETMPISDLWVDLDAE
jgi:hypothetical protein